ncbi:MAG: regulatory protein RecX [Thermoleophilia bacterium]
MTHGSGGLSIAEVAADPRDPARLLVSLSDGRRFRLEAGRLGDVGLAAGLEVDEVLESRLSSEEDRSGARARALRYLEARERSRAEVEQRLRRYGYDDHLVGETLDWLDGLGYVDDRRFAEWFARARTRSAWGSRRLRDELRRKGVAGPVIEEAVAIFTTANRGEEGEVDDLTALVGRRFAREWAADRERAERRITGYLHRRGHEWETIRAVLAHLGRPEPPTDPGDR